MAKPTPTIRFKATLLRPAQPTDATWTFLVLPAVASSRLPTRSMVSVDGTLDGHAFQATLQPDVKGSHWLQVEAVLRKAAGAAAGDTVELVIAPVSVEPEPVVPADLRKALAANPAAHALWADLTAIARRDWIHWVTSGKRAETRIKRIAVACDKLASGSRRACCFDRSGMYGNSLSAPKAATADD